MKFGSCPKYYRSKHTYHKLCVARHQSINMVREKGAEEKWFCMQNFTNKFWYCDFHKQILVLGFSATNSVIVIFTNRF